VIAQVAITGEDFSLLEVAHLEPCSLLEQIKVVFNFSGVASDCSIHVVSTSSS